MASGSSQIPNSQGTGSGSSVNSSVVGGSSTSAGQNDAIAIVSISRSLPTFFLFLNIYILAVSTYSCFWEIVYHGIAVPVSRIRVT